MRLIELSDANSFLDRSRHFLVAAEAENNLLISSAWALAKSSAVRSPKLSFFIVDDGHAIKCAALNATDRRLLISNATPDAAAFMGSELARREVRIKGVLGPDLPASSLSESFGQALGLRFKTRHRQRIMRLEKLIERTPTTGLLRVAKDKDIRLLLSWSLDFVRESGLDETPQETEEVVRRYVDNRQLFIWEDAGPVAMAGWGGLTPNGVRVSMVYTPPKARGRGYAGSLVSLMSRRLLSQGRRYCFLFTDAENPVANRLYEGLGYRTMGDFKEFRFCQ